MLAGDIGADARKKKQVTSAAKPVVGVAGVVASTKKMVAPSLETVAAAQIRIALPTIFAATSKKDDASAEMIE